MERHTFIMLFDALIILAVVLVASSLFTAILSETIQRSITWYNFMFEWLVIALSFTLLFGQQEGLEPPFAFCTFQALLVHAVPVMGGMGLICHFTEFHLIISSCICGETLPANRWRTFWLVASPWILFLAIIIIDTWLIFVGGHIHDIERASTGYYCHAKSDFLVILSAVIPTTVSFVGILLQVWTGILMYRYWDVFEHLWQDSRRFFVTMYLRMVACTLVSVIGIILGAFAFHWPWSDNTSLCYPVMLIVIAVALGTQKDIFRAWIFWRTPHSPARSSSTRGTDRNRNGGPPKHDVIQIIGPNVEEAHLKGNDTKSRS